MTTRRTNSDSLSRAHRQRLTEARKQAFLEALRIHGVATRAAREASPGAKGTGAIRTFRDERARSIEFAQAWDEAIQEHHGDLLAELYRRATIGDAIPIVSPTGEVVGFKHNRSDALLLAAVRAHVPDFTPRTEQTVEQTVTKTTRTSPLDVERLSPESRADLKRILERELGVEPTRNGTPSTDRLPNRERER